MPTGPAARIADSIAHPLPPVIGPGPGSMNVLIGSRPAWRGVPAAVAAGLQAAKTVSDAAITAAEAATVAAMGTPGAPAAKAAEEGVKAAAAAAMGSAITILIAGPGPLTLTDGFAVTPQPPAVFIDGFYCNGIAAKVGPVDGLPGDVYQLSVFVPSLADLVKANPDLKNFVFPAQSGIQVWMGMANAPVISQGGVFVNVK